MIVDHAHRTVINGARVLATEELLDFATPEQRFARIEDYIDRLLTLNPKITQGEIFQKLRKQRAYIKKGVIHFDGQTRPLKPFMAEAIDRNNRIRLQNLQGEPPRPGGIVRRQAAIPHGCRQPPA